MIEQKNSQFPYLKLCIEIKVKKENEKKIYYKGTTHKHKHEFQELKKARTNPVFTLVCLNMCVDSCLRLYPSVLIYQSEKCGTE